MARLTRQFQKVFASLASNNGQFGSGKLGTKLETNNIETLQDLSAYETGWLDAVISPQTLPPLEEDQALHYVETYQLAYLFQEGIPEWNALTTYYENSIVKAAGTFELYGSLIDNNTGNALPSGVSDANWAYLGTLGQAIPDASTSTKGIVQLATNSEVATGSSTTKVSPVSAMAYHQGAAKAWVNFNGTGTISVRDSYNVSSVTDNGTGDYTVNFSNSFANSSYAFAGGGFYTGGTNNVVCVGMDSASMSTGSLRINTVGIGTTDCALFDCSYVTMCFFGDR